MRFAASCRPHTAERAASAAQARRAGLEANVSLTAQERLLRSAADVVALWHAAVVAAAASVVHDHLRSWTLK